METQLVSQLTELKLHKRHVNHIFCISQLQIQNTLLADCWWSFVEVAWWERVVRPRKSGV